MDYPNDHMRLMLRDAAFATTKELQNSAEHRNELRVWEFQNHWTNVPLKHYDVQNPIKKELLPQQFQQFAIPANVNVAQVFTTNHILGWPRLLLQADKHQKTIEY
ncbi:hypothetical protein GOP47_0002449, partial [Adiantum capillus-veneris]